MSTLELNKKRINARGAGPVAIVVLMLMVAGCMENYGQFARSADVDVAFRKGDHQPDYQYAYAGRDTMPYAIIGIDRSYKVPSRYWIPFEPESEKLRKMSGNMYGKQVYYPFGSHILAPDGTIIGVWFSGIHSRSVKVDQQHRTVEVLFKNPESSRFY